MYPYSPVVCVIVYIYTLEFGDPPLYAVLNRAIRNRDKSLIETLGPFAKALSVILDKSENHRETEDRIPNGENILFKEGGKMYNVAGSHLLFRGVQMTMEQLEEFKRSQITNLQTEGEKAGKPTSVNLPSYLSCSRSLKEALKFAL